MRLLFAIVVIKVTITEFSNLLWTGRVISGIKDIPKYKAEPFTPALHNKA
jgi:hypothetical protein